MSSYSTCSEESDLSEVSINTKSSYRISVCLRRCFSDVRSRCFILISKKRRVRWLEQRLKKLFSLRGRFYLCANGHLLPSSEPLAVLNPDDRVEVVPHETGPETAVVINNHSIINNENEDHCGKDTPDTSYINHSLVTNGMISSSNSSELRKYDMQDVECYEEKSGLMSTSQEDVNVDGEESGGRESLHGIETLQEEKRRALALLDEQLIGAALPTLAAPRRRRVRRRRTPRAPLPAALTSPLAHHPAASHDRSPTRRCNEILYDSQAPPSAESCSPAAECRPTSPFLTMPTSAPVAASALAFAGAPVARNNDNCPRKPRLIQPVMEIKNIHMTFPV